MPSAAISTAIFKAVSVGTLVIVLFAFLYRGGFVYRDYSYSRFVFVIDSKIVMVALVCFFQANAQLERVK